MKTPSFLHRIIATLLAPILLLHAPCSLLHAAVTGRSADSSIAGTEKLLSDSSGTDTYILVSTLYSGMALSGGLTASGSTAFDFSGSTGAFKTSTGLNTFGGSGHAFASVLYPSTSDGAALGDSTHHFSDLFLATGGLISFNNGNVLLTHSDGVLTLGTGNLIITTAGTAAGSVATISGTQTLTNKTITSAVIDGATASGSTAINLGGNSGTFTTPSGANVFTGSSHSFAAKLFPATDDGAALGDTTHHFSDLFLASGAVLNFNNGNVAVTHSSGILTVGTGDLRVTTAGTNAASVVTVGGTQTLTNKTLTAPVLGAATATSINGLTIDTTTGTFDLTNGKTLAVTGSLTFAGTDSTTMTFPATSSKVMTSSLTSNSIDVINSVWGASNALVWEGATADAHETSLTATDATADRTVTIPNATGTVHLAQASTTTALTADDQAVTPGSNTVLQLTSDNATATNRTFTLSATGAITGQIYVLIGPATNQCEIADTGIQVLSATWSPTTGDTLTLLFDGTNFTEIARSNN